MAVKFFGSIEQFAPGDDVESYLERLERLLVINAIKTEEHVNYFLTLIGGVDYTKLKTLVIPKKVESLTYDELKSVLIGHYKPKYKVIAERFKFYNRNQKPGENISDYVMELKLLASTCKFVNVEESIRDRLVMGVTNTTIQDKLLDENDNLTLDEAIAKATNAELTNAQVQQIKTEKVENVNDIKKKSSSSTWWQLQ